MAVQQITLMTSSGTRFEFKMEDAVATQLLLDFGTIPAPEKQDYVIKVGNWEDGFVDSILWIDWENSMWALAMSTPVAPAPPT